TNRRRGQVDEVEAARACRRARPVVRDSRGDHLSAPSSNTRLLLARDHAAPESTLALTKAAQPCRARVWPLAWCSRPRSGAASLEGALMRFRRKQADAGTSSVRLFYASDIHGSDLLWRKFLGASKFYDADAAVMGGDLLGKAIVPIERTAEGTFRAEFLGGTRVVREGEELDELVGAIRFNGYYPWIASRDEIAERGADTDDLFAEVARDEIRRWLDLAEQRTNGGASHLFVMAGNDDPWYIDELLAGSHAIVFCDGRIVRVGPHEMISSSYANPTPWNSPRELDQYALYKRRKGLADRLGGPSRGLFNLHVLPHDRSRD